MSQMLTMCRYFREGTCRHGAACRFSHDLASENSFVCKYFLKGQCSYGSSCQYDHTRPTHASGTAPPTSTGHPASPPATANAATSSGPSDSFREPGASGVAATGPVSAATSWRGVMQVLGEGEPKAALVAAPGAVRSAWGTPAPAAAEPHTNTHHGLTIFDDNVDLDDPWEMANAPEQVVPRRDCHPDVAPCDVALCAAWAESGWCEAGDTCPWAHGDLCLCCHLYVLHPDNPEQRSHHEASCLQMLDLEQHKSASAEMECLVCLEKVMAKESVADRKFGLMDCAHVFCLGCIRSWRENVHADLDSATRTCPVCRVSTHFVTPSTLFPRTPDEKEDIVNGYKNKLQTINCRHFDQGRGSCPFGISCFYRHQLPDGTLQDRSVVTHRTAVTGDWDVKVLQPVTLANFLDQPQAQRLLRRPLR